MCMLNNSEGLLNLAQAADDKGHSASAFEFYRRLIALDPANDRAIYRAVRNLLEIGRIADAESLFSTIKHNAAPKPWLMEVFLGKLRLAQFKPTEAEEHFRKAWKLGSNSTAPAIYLADCLISQERFSEASDILMGA